MSRYSTFGVLGGGAWGTALANAAARAGHRVVLWEHDEGHAAALAETRLNARYLPGVDLADAVHPTADISALREVDAALMVVPAQVMGEVAERARPHLVESAPVISCAKGIERTSLRFMTQIIAAAMPGHSCAVLSGPSFAADVARGLPTAVTIAAPDEWVAADLAAALSSPGLRLYHSDDVLGVEVGGAAKNVLAIGAGIAQGRGLGASAVAALVARGFAELRRLGIALGARPETLMGLSGLGDLVLTATSPQSRNFAFGAAIGAGEPPPEKLAEGAFTAQALIALADRHEIELPISRAVSDVIARKITVEQAIEALLARPLRLED